VQQERLGKRNSKASEIAVSEGDPPEETGNELTRSSSSIMDQKTIGRCWGRVLIKVGETVLGGGGTASVHGLAAEVKVSCFTLGQYVLDQTWRQKGFSPFRKRTEPR